ncbi:MAG: LacI family DNA-binding transcriptional regulator [Fimbriimonas sp.]
MTEIVKSSDGAAAISRWRTIYDSLLARIESGELAAGVTLPTEVDLAAEWGVSRLTAHRALYELARSGIVVRKRKVGTVVLPFADRPSMPVSIAGLFFETSDYFQGNYLSCLRNSLSDDVHLVYVDTGHDPMRENHMLRRMQKECQGMVLFATCAPENDQLLGKIVKSGFPLVFVDRYPANMDCDSVSTDNYNTTRQAIRTLQQAGHRAIAHITDNEMNVTSVRDRFNGYRDEMEEAGLFDRSLVRLLPYIAPVCEAEYEQMIQLVQDALVAMRHGSNPPTAVFCLRDHLTGAVCEAANRIGIRIPEDLEVLGYNERPNWLLKLPDGLWTIQQNVAEIAALAAQRVRARLGGEQIPFEHVLVPGRLIGPGLGSD